MVRRQPKGLKSEILDNFISKSIFNYKNSKPMRQTETQVVCMVLRGRIRSQSLKSWEPCLFPYKEELSAGKMEFTAAEDTDLHLTGDLRDALRGLNK